MLQPSVGLLAFASPRSTRRTFCDNGGAGGFPVSKVCQNPMFFDFLGLTSSEEHIPQVDENTEKAKWLLVVLESAVTRPRQARYQAALRPDVTVNSS
jgi:hypothetical protein